MSHAKKSFSYDQVKTAVDLRETFIVSRRDGRVNP
jgi:hypothetical protein